MRQVTLGKWALRLVCLAVFMGRCTHVHAGIIVDGTRDVVYGKPLVVQTVNTQFGDAHPPGSLGGSELDAAYAVVDGDWLYLMITGNLEPNLNRLELFIDSRTGGEGRLSGTPEYDNFNVTNWTSSNLRGLTFDTGFEADYHLFTRWGSKNGSYIADFVNRNGGGKWQVPVSRGSSFNAVGLFASGTILAGSQAPNASGSALTRSLSFAINNNNSAGVLGGTGPADPVAASAVSTGMEFRIPLADLGNPAPGSDIKIAVMVNGINHDYLSNQFLGGLPAPQDNLVGDGHGGFIGDLSGIDFNQFAGLQYFKVTRPLPFSWDSRTGGNFQNAVNWSNDVLPTATDPALFNLNGRGYSVTTDQDIATGALLVRHDDVQLDLGVHAWTVPHTDTPTLVVGDQGDDEAKLTLSSGKLTAGRVSVGRSGNAAGTLILDGPTSHLEILDADLSVGMEGTALGRIDIRNGAKLSTSGSGATQVALGLLQGTVGTTDVSGQGSQLQVGGDLFVGGIGLGVLRVTDSGHVDVAQSVQIVGSIIPGNPSGAGTVHVAGGSLNVADRITIGTRGTGLLKVNQGTVHAMGQVVVGSGTTDQFANFGDGTLIIENGGVLTSSLPTGSSGTIAAVTDKSHGTVVVKGVGSKWTQDGNLSVGSVGYGTMWIFDGGRVESIDAQVARTSTATGETHLDGVTTQWSVRDRLIVGGAFASAGGPGLVEASNGARVTAGNLVHLWGQGMVDLTLGGSLDIGAIEASQTGVVQVGTGGTLGGLGRIRGHVDNRGGTVSPGAAIGTLSIEGTYTQESGSSLSIQLGGSGSDEFDELFVSGAATLNGALTVSFTDLGTGTFVPHLGQSFNILTAVGGIHGAFASTSLPAIASGLDWQILYLADSVQLRVVESTGFLAADLNRDGAVDAADAGIMFANWGNSGEGDLNIDSIVDAADAGLLFEKWTGDSVTVPEPGSILLAALSVGSLLLRKTFPRQ